MGFCERGIGSMAFLGSRNASHKWYGVLEFRYPANGTCNGFAELALRGQWTLLRDTVQKKGGVGVGVADRCCSHLHCGFDNLAPHLAGIQLKNSKMEE